MAKPRSISRSFSRSLDGEVFLASNATLAAFDLYVKVRRLVERAESMRLLPVSYPAFEVEREVPVAGVLRRQVAKKALRHEVVDFSTNEGAVSVLVRARTWVEENRRTHHSDAFFLIREQEDGGLSVAKLDPLKAQNALAAAASIGDAVASLGYAFDAQEVPTEQESRRLRQGRA